MGPDRSLHVDGHRRGVAVDDEYVAQHDLQRIERLVLQVEQRVEVLVPLSHRIEEAEHRDDGPAEREDEGEEEADIRAAVDGRRLVELVADVLLEEGARDDDVPHRDGVGQDDGPAAVVEAEVAHHQVERDRAAAEEHGEEDQLGDQVTAIELLA